MIVFDTEGTDLMRPEVVTLAEQPSLVEFAGIKLDEKLREVSRLHFLCNPGIVLPELFTKITGIAPEQIADKPPLVAFYTELVDFFLGEREMVAHNMGYDEGLLRVELTRMGKLINFPWPPVHICTVEASIGLKGHRLSLSDLYLLAAGKTEKDRVAFAPGMLVKHKTLGKVTLQKDLGDGTWEVLQEKGRKVRKLKNTMLKGAAFEGAHGAMKDAEELVAAVRWLRKGGHL